MKPGIRHSVLISSARFGGNYFLRACQRSLLRAQPLGEIFRKGSDGKALLAEALRLESAQVARLATEDPVALWESAKNAMSEHNLIAKLYYYHQPATSPLWAWLATNEDRIIHILRRNLFDAYVSREIAEKFNLWSGVNSETIRDISITLTIDEAEASSYIQKKTEEIEFIRELYADREDYHEVFFEDITLTPKACVAAIGRIFDGHAMLQAKRINDMRDSRVKRVSNSTIIRNYRDISYLDRTHVY